MYFVWISELAATITRNSINWLVFITEAESVYCAVRTETVKSSKSNESSNSWLLRTIRSYRMDKTSIDVSLSSTPGFALSTWNIVSEKSVMITLEKATLALCFHSIFIYSSDIILYNCTYFVNDLPPYSLQKWHVVRTPQDNRWFFVFTDSVCWINPLGPEYSFKF
jgi:hypothetical protein